MVFIRKFLNFFLRVKWLAILVAFGFVLGVGASTLYRGAFGRVQRTDLTVYLAAAETISQNRPSLLYSVENSRHWHYIYTPLLAILISPVAHFPLPVNILLVYLSSVGALIGTCWLSHYFGEKHDDLSWKILLSIILCAPIFLETITRAQLGIMMLFFSAMIYFCYLKNRKIAAGSLLGFAVALKFSPIAFTGLFFLFKKEWKIVASAAISCLFFLFVLPLFFIGARENWELLKTWYDLMSAGSSDAVYNSYLFEEIFSPFQINIQSIYAVLTRFFWPSEQSFIGGSNLVIRAASQLIGIMLLGALFLKRLPAKTNEKRSLLFAEYALYPMCMLFASPVSQDHHYTSLYLLVFSALLLLRAYPEKSLRAFFLVVSMWTAAIGVFTGFVFDPVEFAGGPLWGSLFLWLVVFFCIAQSRTSLFLKNPVNDSV